MNKIHIITPVKNSFGTTIKAIESVCNSDIKADFNYTIYNDFSDEETTFFLEEASIKFGFELVNLTDITTHPSPNYLLVLQLAQKKAIQEKAHLVIVESDVLVEKNTIQQLVLSASDLVNPGLIAAATTDEKGEINFPYLYARKYKIGAIKTKKRLSFCCTLLTNTFLSSYNFENLNPEKSWYDIFISHKSSDIGFSNYLLTNVPVLHLPHSSRPWKKLKYTNPLKYYWQKITKKRDKI